MGIAAIALVVILVFLVSGYHISFEEGVGRQGLLQLSSIPSGATVVIDGVELPWIQRTNVSRNLSSDSHTILLKREGYDSWTKTINVTEGLLYRLHYPRLFLQNRVSETVLDTANYNSATISPDHNYMLLMDNTTGWLGVDLTSETLAPVKLDVSKLFQSVANQPADQKGIFNGEIQKTSWDKDGSHLLLKVSFGDTTEWVLLDVKNPTSSTNLTKEFGGNFDDIQIIDNSSNNLLAIQNHNLHRINLGNKSISSVLVENINDFDHFNQNEIVFSAKNPDAEGEEDQYIVGVFKLGDNKPTILTTTSAPAKVTLSKFYEDKYITTLIGSELTVYKKDNFEKIKSFELSFTPDQVEVGHSGEFIIMTKGNQIATLDMESMNVIEWSPENANFGWIDNDMFYVVQDGTLIVYDYDGLNRREIGSNISGRFPAAITDDKWLYYFRDGSLVREWLIEH